MKLNFATIEYRIERIKRAFANREDSQQISARTAKLVYDTSRGKVAPSVLLAKSISLYLRRQQHLYGDEAYESSLREISAFLAETGELQDYENYVLEKSSSTDIDNREYITAVYQDKGPYGLISAIEKSKHLKSRSQKASKLLQMGKILKTTLNEQGIRSQMAKLALALDKSEPTYRGACWSMLNDDNAEEALELYAYLHFYYQDLPNENLSLIEPLTQKMKSCFGNEFIHNYLKEKQALYREQKRLNIIQEYRKQLITKDKAQQKNIFLEFFERAGDQGIIELINDNQISNNKTKAILALRAAQAIKSLPESEYHNESIERFADYALSKDKSEGTLRNAYFIYRNTHSHEKSAQLLSLLEAIAGDNPTQKQRNLLWSAPGHLLTLTHNVPERLAEPAYIPVQNKVCYVIHNSLPYSSGGYATRGHGLITGLLGQGVNIYALTRPGYPHDVSKINIKDIAESDVIDNATYKRIYSPSRRHYSNYEYILKAVESYKQAFLADKPALVIAASNHLDGLPAMFAARQLGVPFIYEIRGFWEVTRLSKYPKFAQDPMFEVEKRLEALVAEHADYIFTLTQGMVDELSDRGVDTNDKIALLPNSCDVTRFNPQIKDKNLARELDIPLTIPVIGYVGTLVSYEGLDDLAVACAQLKKQGYEFRLLIVGNENATGQGKGSIVEQVQGIAREGGFEEWLIMPGRIPFEHVESYYSLIDIAPFPRKAWPVCEMVPPMKTLEALSMKKAVIVSSNKALTEMIEHDVNGRVYERGNVEDLTSQLKYLLDHPEKWESYGVAGRDFVENERTWKQTSKKAKKIIDDILAAHYH